MKGSLLFLLICACDSNSDLKYNEASSELGDSEEFQTTMELSDNQLAFEVVDDSTTLNKLLTVTNIGENPLEIDRIDITNSGTGIFYVDETDYQELLIEIESSIEVMVIMSGLEEIPTEAIWGELRIKSNDQENPDQRIPLCAYPSGGDCS